MSAQQVEELLVACADIAFGTMLVFLDPERFPAVLEPLADRLGRARRPLGAAIIVLGATLVVSKLR